MESYLLAWSELLLRWVHVITAIAWVGSSFYFVFLDSSLTPPVDDDLQRQGVSGELWAVHGGGFYHPVKFAVRPPVLPPQLHWFAGRAAFLLVGAMMATAMSANVFFRIIPGQRKVVAAIKAGQPVDLAVYQQVVLSRLMPMNNATGITEAERALIGQWFLAGASTP